MVVAELSKNYTVLPCPFCGDKPVSVYPNQNDKWGGVYCGCGAGGPEVRTSYDDSSTALWHADAVSAWNDRAHN